MTQRDLNRAVARATGESLATISRAGFSPLAGFVVHREPQTVDWDVAEQQRNVAVFRNRQQTPHRI